jgi:uridine monophosphate synthetase
MDKQLIDLASWTENLISRLAPHIVGIKPNLAFWESSDRRETLAEIMYWTSRNHPELVRILDVKRGDIANTQENWADADMENFEPDIITINPYMGWQDTIEPYLDWNDKICAFALTSTSNKDTEIQNMYAGGLHVYQQMALSVRNANRDRVGLVVGATKPEAIRSIRAAELENGYAPEDTAWVLAPGFGRQGGDLSFVSLAGPNAVYPISSGLVNEKYLNGKTPAQAAEFWKNAINEASATGYNMKSMSELFVEDLIRHGILKIAPDEKEESWFTLKSGTRSPLYWEASAIQSFPALLEPASYLMTKKIKDAGFDFERVAPVAYGALGFGYSVARDLHKPVIVLRKEGAKDHGTKKDIIGYFEEGDRAVIIEDVATSGTSTLETKAQLNANSIQARDAVVLIDREQGATKNLAENDVALHSVLTQTEAIEKMDKSHPMRDVVMNYLRQNVKH